MFDSMILFLGLYAAKAVIYGWIIGIFSGFCAVFAFDNLKRDNTIIAEIWGLFAATGLVFPFSYFSLNFFLAERVGLSQMPIKYLVFWLFFTVIGAGFGVWFHRVFTSKFDVFKSKITKKTEMERNKKTDVRNIDALLPTPEKFNPEDFFNQEKGIFLGLDEGGKPLYWPASEKMPHIQISGTTGSGKGVAIQILAAQAAQAGHALFIADPKNDEWMPHALKAACEKVGVPFHFVDLRPEAPPQLNIFDGASRHEINELLQAGFALAEKGDNADFYRLKDRQAAALVASMICPGESAAQVYQKMGADLERSAEGFAGLLKEMAEIPSVNATDFSGLQLSSVVENGGVVYVVGSMRFEPVKRLQKMIVMRAIQLAERRERLDEAAPLRPVGIVMDEFIYHISRGALEALGGARDKGVYCVIAFQSLGDLFRVPADLSAEAVKGALIDNCKLKITYQIQDPDTAAWLAEATGTILADDESRKVEKNLALVETLEGERTIRQSERFLIDQNMMMNLPRGVGVVIGLKDVLKGRMKAEFLCVDRLNVKKDKAAIETKAAFGGGYAPPTFDDLPEVPTVKPVAEFDDLPPLPVFEDR